MNSDNPKYEEKLDEARNQAEIMITKELEKIWEKYKKKFEKFEDEDTGQLAEDFVEFVFHNVYSIIDY